MKKTLLLILGIGVATLSLFAQETSENKVKIVIKKLESAEGSVRVTLFNTEEDWLEKGISKSVQVNNKKEVTVEFENVVKGTYAVSVIHDENSNGELDTNFGIPSEPYGFSNNARGMFGPASFEDSKFEVAGSKQIEIDVK